MFINHSLLIIGSVWPEPNSSAAGSRMMQLIELFLKNNYKITFACTAGESQHMVDLKSIGINQQLVELNSSTFDKFIIDLNPNLVLFDRFMVEEQFGWRVSESCPEALRIMDTVDLHCLRHARHKALKENKLFATNDLVSDYAKREIASILRCDLSLIISKYEMDLLKTFFKVDDSLLHYIPFMLPNITNEEAKAWRKFEERKNFISIGNFLHEPNWDSVKYLSSEVWPLIKKQLPDAELHIYGAYPSQKVFELNKPKEGFIIKGRAENALDVMKNARVCLAPLRFGAGMKGKLIDAMITGTPSITTSIGAESMHDDLPWNGTVSDTVDEIVNASINLYSNKTIWHQAQQNGVAIINTCFQKNSLGELFIDKINLLFNTLEKHRLNNFMGAMLMHSTLQSTKYMSRWIEEKNKI